MWQSLVSNCSKLTKCHHINGQKISDHEKLLEKSSDCTK